VDNWCWFGSKQTFAECAKVGSYTKSLVVNCSQPVRRAKKVSVYVVMMGFEVPRCWLLSTYPQLGNSRNGNLVP
jgi:hypothetical protein